MTKKVGVNRLFAVLVGAMLCLCMTMVVTTGTGALNAHADGDLPSMKLEEIDLFSTVGYKIEKVTDGKWTDAATGTEYTYDYKFTLATGNYIVKNSGTKKFLVNNAEELIFNVKTSTDVDVTADCAVSTSKWTISSTDTYGAGLTAQKRTSPSIGLEVTNESVARTFYTQASVDTTCDGTEYDCTTNHEIKGVLRLLVEVKEVQNNEFLYTGAINDKNDKKSGMWLTFAPNDVLGVSTADEEWTRAERDTWIAQLREFFENIYFLQGYNLEAATAAPTAEDLAGKDLYSLMTGDTSADSWLFQTEVRHDHIEIYKGTRSYDSDVEGVYSDYVTGDAFYLKEDLKMPGKDGNGNWTIASEGGSQNVLTRNQFYVFDGTAWSYDQYGMSLALDKNEVLLEVGSSTEVQANVDAGKFASSADTAVTWTSDTEAVATVSGGTVTAVAEGEAVISASLTDGTIATVNVTVVRADQINSIKLDKRNVTLYTGNTNNTYTLVPTIEGGSAADRTVTWTSSDETVVTVDSTGKLTAVAEGGPITITATAADGQTATCTVSVLKGQSGEENPGGDKPEPKPGDTESKKGCGSNVAATSSVAGIALVLCVAAVLVSRKKKASNE